MDIRRLIEHHQYGFDYHGDASRDTVDTLELVENMQLELEERKEYASEAIASLPDEDFLQELIDILFDAKKAKRKDETKEIVDKAINVLHNLQQELNSKNEYISDLLK